jgi:predicted flap endonuclease-1-like 5' DNA nuclease
MENLFAALTQEDSIAFLLSVLVAFLIGFVTAWVLWGGRAARARREAKKWKDSYDTAQIAQNALREQLDLRDADLVKAQREGEDLAAHIRLMEEEKAKWQAGLDAATESTAQAHSNARSYAATIEDLNNQILGLKARLSQQERDGGGQSAEAKTQAAEMKSSYDATVNRLNSLEEKISLLLAENTALRTQKPATSSKAASPKKEAKAAPVTEDSRTSAPADSVAAQKAVMGAIGTKIPSATADAKDDLTLIRGIGSFLEKKLNNLGIYTYEQISRFDGKMIDNVTAAIAFFPGRIQRDDWVGQATRLMEIKSAQPEALGKAAIFPNNPQDLKIVEGIGPKIEKLLKKAGIGTWEDLAKAKKKTLQKMLEDAGDAYRIHDPATWPGQAKLAVKGEWDKLKEYQDYLKGGKAAGS